MSTRTRSDCSMARPFPGSPVIALRPRHHHQQRLRYGEAHAPGLPGVDGRRRADAERDAPDGTGRRRMRIAADDDHAGLGMALEDLRVTDRLRAVVAEP